MVFEANTFYKTFYFKSRFIIYFRHNVMNYFTLATRKRIDLIFSLIRYLDLKKCFKY